VADLQALRELCDWMTTPEGAASVEKIRSSGLTTVRAGELELHFAPSVPSSDEAVTARDDSAPPTEREPATADDDERHALEELLHSSGANAEALFEMRKRALAREAARHNA
jgi:hypothetical protein